ncbi:MAG: hypothetical protein QM831_02090 [Kofleriaceae bacterium]
MLALLAVIACGPTGPEHVLSQKTDGKHREGAPTLEAGLPAMARGLELFVMPVPDYDERGGPKIHLEVRDRADKLVETIQPDKANDELQKLHDIHDLVPMHALDVQPTTDGSLAHLAIGDGIDVDFSTDHVHVFRHNSDREVAGRPSTAWLAKSTDKCIYPAFLRAVYHAEDVTAVVVQIAYRGEDACGVPSDSFHVVAW